MNLPNLKSIPKKYILLLSAAIFSALAFLNSQTALAQTQTFGWPLSSSDNLCIGALKKIVPPENLSSYTIHSREFNGGMPSPQRISKTLSMIKVDKSFTINSILADTPTVTCELVSKLPLSPNLNILNTTQGYFGDTTYDYTSEDVRLFFARNHAIKYGEALVTDLRLTNNPISSMHPSPFSKLTFTMFKNILKK